MAFRYNSAANRALHSTIVRLNDTGSSFRPLARSESRDTRVDERDHAKMKTSAILSALCAAFALAAAWPAAAQTQPAQGNADAGRQKSSMCVGCHNIPGYKTAFPAVYSVPKLDGQHAPYIISALRAYKSSERTHPSMR